jgi:hypothetical protein
MAAVKNVHGKTFKAGRTPKLQMLHKLHKTIKNIFLVYQGLRSMPPTHIGFFSQPLTNVRE